jgi:DNA repair photolyase
MSAEENPSSFLSGRGAQINTPNRFHNWVYDENPIEGETDTQFIDVHPKTILNKVDSPDIGMGWSMNPYQGCEHGCVYCYARNSHSYWGYSAGLEFEQKILIKKEAPQLLEEALRKPKWEPTAIMLSGNTDCYQPAERKYRITRQMLEVLWKYRHPVGIITKNSLILRDLDILEKMAENNLVRVAISLTTLNESLRRLLEPRTATGANRVKTIKTLSEHGIPVSAMLAPIIPSLNDHEIMDLAKAAADAGARRIHHQIVRWNGDVAPIFEDWIAKSYPDRAEKVLNKIKALHGGTLNDSRFGQRMKGEGNFADIIEQQVALARRKYFEGREVPPYNLELYRQMKNPQLNLFD